MLDQKKFLIIGGILAVVIVVTLVVVLTRKKDAPDTSGAPSPSPSPVPPVPPVPCGNVVTLPNGTQAICPPGWDNRFTSWGGSHDIGCDEDKDQCMACIGPEYPRGAPGPAYTDLLTWPGEEVKNWSVDGLDAGPSMEPKRMASGGIYVTNPLPLPPGMNCAASDANGVLL